MPDPKVVPDKPQQVDPDEAFELKFKERLKSQYEIEDDPDTYKGRVKKWREVEEVVPHYEAALQTLTHQLNQPKPEPKLEPKPENDEAELERIRVKSQTDPVGAMIDLNRYNQKTLERRLEERDRTLRESFVSQTQGARMQDTAAQYLMANWPEVYDQKSDLHKVGRAIYLNELSDFERKSPTGFLRAAEAAAARLGIPPKARRAAPKADEPSAGDLAAQSPEGRNPKGKKAEDDSAPLNAKQKKMAQAMGLDEKGFKKTMAARRAGKDVRVE